FLLAYPVVRLRDDYLAILTIGFAEIVRIFANNLRFTGGPQGVWGIKPPMLTWGLSYDLWRWVFLGFCVLLLALVMILIQYITRSPYGRVLMAIREDQDAATSLGKNTTSYKLLSFGLGAAVAGLAGGLLAAFLQTITPNNFVALVTFEAWIIMVLGGAGRNWGVILGALMYYGIFTASSRLVVMGVGGLAPAQLGALRIALIGVLLIVLMIYRPQGILGRKEDLTVGR
ncbi:MAG: branched-chain amino acid ABC transporter permease, partial [Bacillota bacterium]|nr:branched-chain amino acid ABC transporter permease [Bacillota bacterium]